MISNSNQSLSLWQKYVIIVDDSFSCCEENKCLFCNVTCILLDISRSFGFCVGWNCRKLFTFGDSYNSSYHCLQPTDHEPGMITITLKSQLWVGDTQKISVAFCHVYLVSSWITCFTRLLVKLTNVLNVGTKVVLVVNQFFVLKTVSKNKTWITFKLVVKNQDRRIMQNAVKAVTISQLITSFALVNSWMTYCSYRSIYISCSKRLTLRILASAFMDIMFHRHRVWSGSWELRASDPQAALKRR